MPSRFIKCIIRIMIKYGMIDFAKDKRITAIIAEKSGPKNKLL